jgi:hypothetical protein
MAQRARPQDADRLASGMVHDRIANAPAVAATQALAEALRTAGVVRVEL